MIESTRVGQFNDFGFLMELLEPFTLHSYQFEFTRVDWSKNPLSKYLMKAHFYQAINETEHLEEMESRSGNRYWVDRFLARHLVLFYYWVMVFYYLLSPSNAYDINIKIEEHAYETYAKYLTVNPNDQRIREIAQDEINHANELKEAIALIS